jgi:hypothetical protein
MENLLNSKRSLAKYVNALRKWFNSVAFVNHRAQKLNKYSLTRNMYLKKKHY